MADAKIVTLGKSPVLHNTSGPKKNAKTGEPFANNWTYYEHSSGNFKSGVWDCTAGSWEHNHPKTEFCYIADGSVEITEEDTGITHVFDKGSSFVVPKGTRVTWNVKEYAKKLFVSALDIEGE